MGDGEDHLVANPCDHERRFPVASPDFPLSIAEDHETHQWPCTGGDNQKWHRYSPAGDPGAYYYVNANSGKCLEIADWSTQPGAPVRLWSCTQNPNQSFSIKAVDW
ncbi:RICIN domain-containing protein [Streptomyces sp. NPDC059534]|uniref:RICIN domain-containing protein n=1 Tax=Streptomyces sp. NPDC059534 TaxID=3346859 RepID=UPI0036A1B48B